MSRPEDEIPKAQVIKYVVVKTNDTHGYALQALLHSSTSEAILFEKKNVPNLNF